MANKDRPEIDQFESIQIIDPATGQVEVEIAIGMGGMLRIVHDVNGVAQGAEQIPEERLKREDRGES